MSTIEAGDTIETQDGREVLVQFVKETDTGQDIEGRYIAEDGSVDELAKVHIPKHKTKVRVSWTEVIPRSTELVVWLDDDELEDLGAGYGFGDKDWATRVSEAEGGVDMLHDEVDYIEILEEDI
jgi:hypothetical protein